MFDVPIDLDWFVVGEAIIGTHPLTNALITLFFLRPYRRALRKIFPTFNRENHCRLLNRYYNSVHDADNVRPTTVANGSLVNVFVDPKDNSVTAIYSFK